MNRRHRFFYRFLYDPVRLFLRLKFGYRFQKAENLPENYIVLSNHATDYDPILVAMSFKRQMYFVASEHITRWKIAYPLLKYTFAPIVRYKGTVAASTVMDILRKTKKGESVCMFAEGVRTWDGVTCPIHPSTVQLIKASRCGLVTYRLSGGYLVSPMWATTEKLRRGPLSGAPVRVYTKEEIRAMSEEELTEAINADLYEDAYDRQRSAPQKYKGKHLAEGLEQFLFLCPHCRAHNSFRTENNRVICSSCEKDFTYNEYGFLENAPFETVREFSLWQRAETERDAREGKSYRAESVSVAKIVKHQSEPFTEGELQMSPTALRCGELCVEMKDIPHMAMHGTQALVFAANGEYYEIIPKSRDNMLRFLWYYDAVQAQKETQTV